MVCVCNGPTILDVPFKFSAISLLVFVAIASIIIVLPTVAIFINEENEFFLLGYTTPSIYGSLLSIGLIHVWVRCYHLVCRDCYQVFKNSCRIKSRVIGIVWVLVGTALVEIWVSSAWALHLAFTAYMDLKEEKKILWNMIEKVWKFVIKIKKNYAL